MVSRPLVTPPAKAAPTTPTTPPVRAAPPTQTITAPRQLPPSGYAPLAGKKSNKILIIILVILGVLMLVGAALAGLFYDTIFK